jgi:integrase
MNINISRRKRRRVQRDGSIKHQIRWVVSWHIDGARNQRFFETRVEAAEFRNRLLTNEAPARPSNVTVGDAIRAWFETRKRTTRTNTHTTYEHRAKLLEPLRSVRIDMLTTKSIREWHDGIDTVYSANKALSVLKSALALHAEDTGTRSVPMPTNLQKRLERPTRTHLTIDQVRGVIANGGIYVAFPFLAGTRISEQLGLCWDCVDFDAGLIRIKRVQDKQTGRLIETTKTASGQRIIPMSETLRRMLAEWKPDCPSLERLFPAPQGGVLLYNSYLRRIWTPTLTKLGLPRVSIHSARASFISMLQASGTELAVAAKLAGHKTPAVTLQYYTHALKGGEQAMAALDAELESQL